MRTLVTEQTLVLPIAAAGTGTVGTPFLRPRLEGYRTALRAQTLSAQYVDRAQVSFTVTPLAAGGLPALLALTASLTVQQAPVLGTQQIAFPALAQNVTAAFGAAGGRLSLDVQLSGVVQVQLALTNNAGTATQYLVQVQVYGDQRAIDVEDVADLDNAALPDGRALAQLLDG